MPAAGLQPHTCRHDAIILSREWSFLVDCIQLTGWFAYLDTLFRPLVFGSTDHGDFNFLHVRNSFGNITIVYFV